MGEERSIGKEAKGCGPKRLEPKKWEPKKLVWEGIFYSGCILGLFLSLGNGILLVAGSLCSCEIKK